MKDPYDLKHPPLVIVMSGTSGSGKDSVVEALRERMERKGSPVHFVVTATSRPRRETEAEGVDYFFVSEAEFEEMIARDELLEYAVVYGDYKGIPKAQVREAMDSGKDVVMRLDIQGAATIRSMATEAVLIFVTASSEQELERRLRRRLTESEEQLRVRLQTAREEMQQIPEFDYVIPNPDGKLDQAVETVLAIISAEKHRTKPRRARL